MKNSINPKEINLKELILKNKKNILYFTLPILFFLVLVSFTGRYLEEVPKSGGSITEIIIGESPRNVNPVLATSKSDKDVLPLIYSTVLKNDEDGNIVPNIADFKISEDNKTYTLTLKDNVKFSNGDDLISDDIIFTIEKIQDPLIQSPYFSEWIEVETEKIDDKNLKIILPEQYDQFKNTLTSLYVLPKKLWQDISPSEFAFFELNNHPIGSGPYMIDQTIRDEKFGKIKKYILVKNPNYFEDQPFISELNLVFFDNLEDYKQSLLYTNRKIIKNIFSISPETVFDFANDDTYLKYDIKNLKSTRVFGLFLNPKNTFLSSEKVRKAISLIVDRNKIVDEAMFGYGTKTDSPIYFDTYTETKSNKEEIDKILKDVGYVFDSESESLVNTKTKKALEINLSVLNSEEFEVIAEDIALDLSEYGIKTNIVTFTDADLINNVIRPRGFDMVLYGYQTSIIPDYYFLFHSTQTEDPQINISGTNNKKIDEAVSKLREVIPQTEKEKMYNTIKEQIQTENLFIPLYSPNYIYITDKRIKGIGNNILNSREIRFTDIKNWYINTGNIIPFLK